MEDYTNTLKSVLNKRENDLAFLIGNGVNRHKSVPGDYLSWDDLLQELWGLVHRGEKHTIEEGVSVTEIYDLLDLDAQYAPEKVRLAQHVCKRMTKWKGKAHHQALLKKAKAIDAPILTTNYECTLHDENMQLHHVTTKGFTDFYPWSSYYADEPLKAPNDGFGVWHVNGMIRYPRSIKLGLMHYMGCVDRARDYIYKGGNALNRGDLKKWSGRNTWLDIFMKRSLFIVGLGLYENEVFFRWLLIERAKFYKRFPEQFKQGWYVTKKGVSTPLDVGRRFFLERLGITYVEVDSYEDVYEYIWE